MYVVVVHVWEEDARQTCRVESLRVNLGAKAREWRMNAMEGEVLKAKVIVLNARFPKGELLRKCWPV